MRITNNEHPVLSLLVLICKEVTAWDSCTASHPLLSRSSSYYRLWAAFCGLYLVRKVQTLLTNCPNAPSTRRLKATGLNNLILACPMRWVMEFHRATEKRKNGTADQQKKDSLGLNTIL